MGGGGLWWMSRKMSDISGVDITRNFDLYFMFCTNLLYSRVPVGKRGGGGGRVGFEQLI